jgi:7-alpha-hydroxysteroid dehydrogenase
MDEQVGSRLQGRVAIVTGASRGIGAGLAEALARQGAAVAVAARSESTWNERLPGTIGETVERIQRFGGRAVAVKADMTVDADLVNLVETASAQLGTVDILVNNAAVTVPGRPPSPRGHHQESGAAAADARGGQGATSGKDRMASFLSFPLKGFRRHFEVNVFAAYRLMQLVLPGMIQQRRGSVLNVTSDASRRPPEGPYHAPQGTTTFAYGGSKAALEHLTRAVAYEMQPHGVGVNALMPSLPVATPGLLYQSPNLRELVSMESFCEAAIRLICSDPDEVAGSVAYSEDVLHPEQGRRGWLGSV